MSAVRSPTAATAVAGSVAASPGPGVRAAAAEPGASAALLGFALAGFCSFVGFYASMPLLPLLQRVFAVSKAEAALTVSAPTIAVALASPFAGVVARRFGYRRTVVGALLVLPIPALLAATSPTVHALVAWRFLQGLAVPGIYAVAMAYLSARWPPATLGRAMSALITGNVIGGFSGRFLSGIVADHLGGWRVAFVAIAVVTAAGAVTASRLLPRDGTPRPGDAAATERASLRDLVGQPKLLATFGVGFMVLFTQVATFTYVTFHLSAPPFELSTSALSYLFTVYLVGAVVTPFAGRWIDRVGSRRAITAALGAGAAGAALTLAPWLPIVVVGLSAVSTASFVSQAASVTCLRTAVAPRAQSAASGMYVSLYYVGGALGGIVPAIAWRVGGWTACVALVAAVQLATIALARGAWRTGDARHG